MEIISKMQLKRASSILLDDGSEIYFSSHGSGIKVLKAIGPASLLSIDDQKKLVESTIDNALEALAQGLLSKMDPNSINKENIVQMLEENREIDLGSIIVESHSIEEEMVSPYKPVTKTKKLFGRKR